MYSICRQYITYYSQHITSCYCRYCYILSSWIAGVASVDTTHHSRGQKNEVSIMYPVPFTSFDITVHGLVCKLLMDIIQI